ncbi:MAG TPA: hypothetical protein VGX52_00095 [Burkholderiales bacterium]|nr:hypothetical protein [Burkholderiales bacterium]
MVKVQELIEEPLSSEELAARYRALCEDREVYGKAGPLERSIFAADLPGLFD